MSRCKLKILKILVAVLSVVMFLAPLQANARGLPSFESMLTGSIVDIEPTDLAVPLAAVPPAPQREWQSEMLTERILMRRQEGLDIRNAVPDVTPAFGEGYALINAQISEVISDMISEARRVRARYIEFSFAERSSGDVVSIVIYGHVSSAPPRMLVRSVNFSVNEQKPLTMNQAMETAMEMDIVPLTEIFLAQKIRNDPERYYVAAMAAPLSSQAFYLTDEKFVLLFDGFRLSSGYGGIDRVEILRENIYTTTIPRHMWRYNRQPNEGYLLSMVPLRRVVEGVDGEGGLGYTITLPPRENGEMHIIVKRHDLPVAEMRIGDNSFIISGPQPRSVELETAPFVHDNITYVPITFFAQVLPLTTYTICPLGDITFISYQFGKPRSRLQ